MDILIMTKNKSTQENQDPITTELSCDSLRSIKKDFSKLMEAGLTEAIHKHFGQNSEVEYSISLTPYDHSASQDMLVTNKKTGDVIGVFKIQVPSEAYFNICQDIHIKVNTKELPELEKETTEAKNLTKEQQEELKMLFVNVGNDRPLTRKEIATFIEEIRKPVKLKKIRHSGHFVDQKTKYEKPNKQRDLFDIISQETKEKIGIEIRIEGLKLSPSQDKLINALMKLLHEKSEHSDQSSENFYGGNTESLIVPYGGNGQKEKARVLRIFPSELYKAYLDKDDYSGKEIKNIRTLLEEMELQKFLIIYDRVYEITKEKNKKESRTDRIEDFQSLIKIIKFYEGLTDDEKQKLNEGNEEIRERRGELIIALNPLLTDQISSKYVEYPEDINRRTAIAAGGYRHVTESMICLRDYLMREISSKRKKCEINEEKIIMLLKLDKYKKQGRKKRIADYIESSIQFTKNLRLVTEHERMTGAEGQWKHLFCLNEDF